MPRRAVSGCAIPTGISSTCARKRRRPLLSPKRPPPSTAPAMPRAKLSAALPRGTSWWRPAGSATCSSSLPTSTVRWISTRESSASSCGSLAGHHRLYALYHRSSQRGAPPVERARLPSRLLRGGRRRRDRYGGGADGGPGLAARVGLRPSRDRLELLLLHPRPV